MQFTQNPIVKASLNRSESIRKAFLGGVGLGAFNSVSDVAMLGFQASKAGKGGFVPAMVGQSMTIAAGIPLAGFAAAGISLIPGVGPFAAALIGEALVGYGELRFGSALIKKVRYFTDLNKNVRHLEMGGSYKDSELAQRQRFIAVQDMNASMIPGRRYLGQEALLMHR